MDVNDLEVDGEPVLSGNYTRRCARFEPKIKQIEEPERLDSNYSSGYGSGFKSEDMKDSYFLSGEQTDSGLRLDSCDSCSRNGNENENEQIDNISKRTDKLTITDDDEGVCVSYDSTEVNPVKEVMTRKESAKTHVKQREEPQSVNDRVTAEALTVYGKDSDGDTLLHIAIINEALTLCFKFIQMAPWFDWLDIYNDNLRQTPLHLAVLMNLRAVVRRLMIGGANVEMRDHNGDTPLHIACREGNVEIAKTLLDPVKYAEIKRNDYDVPYQKIPQNLEIRNFSGCTCLHIAAEKGDFDMLNVLLEKGARINNGDGKSGATVLHYAADRNDIKLTLFLVKQYGINLNSTMYSGATPIDIAHGRRNTTIFNILQKLGAKFESSYYESGNDSDSDS